MFELILPHLPPRLQEAILSPDYSEVCVNEDGRVFVEAAGSNAMHELAGIAPTQVQLRHAVNAVARTLARREADETNPILTARLPDGSPHSGYVAAGYGRHCPDGAQVSAELVHTRRISREWNVVVCFLRPAHRGRRAA